MEERNKMGLDMRNYIGGEFLNKDDIEKVSNTWVMMDAQEVDFEGKKKIQLKLQHKDVEKLFTLNQTNLNRLIKIFGTDTDSLKGRVVVLMIDEVEFKGKDVEAIRVDKEATNKHPVNNDGEIKEETVKSGD